MWNGVVNDPDEKRWQVLHLWREERALWDVTDPDYRKSKLHKSRWEAIARRMDSPVHDAGKLSAKLMF